MVDAGVLSAVISFVGENEHNWQFDVESEAFENGDINWDYCRGNVGVEYWANWERNGPSRWERLMPNKYRYEIKKGFNSTSFAMIFRVRDTLVIGNAGFGGALKKKQRSR